MRHDIDRTEMDYDIPTGSARQDYLRQKARVATDKRHLLLFCIPFSLPFQHSLSKIPVLKFCSLFIIFLIA